MAYYIDREALRDALWDMLWDTNPPSGIDEKEPLMAWCIGISDAMVALCKIPAIPAADVRPVVRCRDCKFLGFKDFRGICEYGPICGPITPDSFCSWGKRKKEDDDG